MTLTAEERARRALVDAASLPVEVAHRFGIGIRSEGRRALNVRLERDTKGRTLSDGSQPRSNPTAAQLRKKPWSPLREACSIVAIFSQRGDDKVWRINVDKETRQERKAARVLIRFEGGKVGVK